MRCPACNNEMTEVQVRGTPVDVCKGGCGGVWFDVFELRKFDEPHEFAGRELLEVERNDSVIVDHSAARLCPRSDGVPMVRHFYSAKRLIQVDECNVCAGVWLDHDELNKIRSLFKTDDERRSYNDRVFQQNLGFGLGVLQDARLKHLQRSRNIAQKTRYICPSYYLEGNREWGAF